MARNALQVQAKFPSDAELKKMFGDVPTLKQYQTLNKSVAAAGRVIAKRARELAPRSKPEDRKKRSKKQRQAADWDRVPMRTTIKSVARSYDTAASTFVGPESPHGNKAYFNQPRSRKRRHVLWGLDTGRMFVAARNWIVQAFDETKGQQLEAMKTVLRKAIDEVMRG